MPFCFLSVDKAVISPTQVSGNVLVQVIASIIDAGWFEMSGIVFRTTPPIDGLPCFILLHHLKRE